MVLDKNHLYHTALTDPVTDKPVFKIKSVPVCVCPRVSAVNPNSKKLRQNFIVDQFPIKPLPQHLNTPEIFLAEGKQINTVRIFIDKAQSFLPQFIKPVRLQFSQKNAFLDAHQAVLLALFGNLVTRLIFNNVI